MKLCSVIFVFGVLYSIPTAPALHNAVRARSSSLTSDQIVQKIAQLFAHKGNTQYMINEPITQRDHAEQTAHIAYKAGADIYNIVGALLHDIGNLVGPSAGNAQKLTTTHAECGSDWLKRHGFPPQVYTFADLHTYAKVWLCKRDPDYINQLSFASQESYKKQKEQYEKRSEFEILTQTAPTSFVSLLALRRCDDMAKLKHVEPYPLETWYPFIVRVLEEDHFCAFPRHTAWQKNVMCLQQLLMEKPESFVRYVYGDEQERIEEYLGK